KLLAPGMDHGIDRLPGYDHRHDGRLAGAGRELQGESGKLGVVVAVRVLEVSEDAPVSLLVLRRDLGEPDRRLDSLDLAEEGPHGLRGGLAPVPKETSGLGGHPPTLLGRGTPPVYLRADLADDRFRLVLLFLRRDSPPLVEVEIEIRLARGA